MEREAAGANLCCHNLSHERLSSLAEVNLTSGSLPESLCEGTRNPCSARWSQFDTLRKASGRLLADLADEDLEGWRKEVDLMQVKNLVCPSYLVSMFLCL